MLTATNAPRRRKKATNLSIDSDLLARARHLKINLSQVVEAGLAEAIRRHERAQWLEKNRAAPDSPTTTATGMAITVTNATPPASSYIMPPIPSPLSVP